MKILLVGGIFLVISGICTLVFGERPWRGTLIPEWTAWPEIILGLIVCGLALWDIRRNRGHPKPPVNIDEEAARAEVELDAMYLREHGTPPEKPKKDD